MKSITQQLLVKAIVTATTFTIFGMGAINAQAATVYFLQIDGIKGESTDRLHKDWIDINSFSWGVSGGGRSHGPVFSPFSWTQNLDKSVPSLFVGAALGKYFKNATLDVDVQQAGKSPDVFFQMKFDNVFLTKLDINGTGGPPGVDAALDYSKITMTYTRNVDGLLGTPVIGGWDLTKTGSAFFGSPDVLQGLLLAGPTPSSVPVPAAVWLFGSGLLGLVGIARRKKTG